MTKKTKNNLAIFEEHSVRREWDGKKEKWYFSVVDIVEILAQNSRPRKYWDDLKRRLKLEGSELSEKIGQLKLFSNRKVVTRGNFKEVGGQKKLK